MANRNRWWRRLALATAAGVVGALLLIPAVGRAAVTPEARCALTEETGGAVGGDTSAHATLIWQGFDHYWKRRVAGLWAVPHRVSLFRSGPVEERDVVAEGGVRTTATWEFGQSTGVDGDYMRPLGFYSRVVAPDVEMHRGRCHFTGVDEIGPGEAPRAFQQFDDLLVVPNGFGANGHAVAVVRGLTFRSQCSQREGERCNSNGIWPYRFRVALSRCKALGDRVGCPITVEIGRAWTPARGGIKGIQEKPLNRRVGVEIDVDWVVMSGPSESLDSTTYRFQNSLPTDRASHAEEQTVPVTLAGGGAYPHATVGLSAFGYQFFPTTSHESRENWGRYIGGWNLRVVPRGYDPQTGVLEVGHAGTVWLPKTVRSTGVTFELGLTAIQLGAPDASVQVGEPVQGLLCNDSHDAPAFSAWRRCDKLAEGERTEEAVSFTVPP